MVKLFPFCIPFDFIHLIQALKAEPETPKFEIPVKLDFVDVDTSIVIDLAWMDPIMKIWRLGELGLFIVMLMKSTSKMIIETSFFFTSKYIYGLYDSYNHFDLVDEKPSKK